MTQSAFGVADNRESVEKAYPLGSEGSGHELAHGRGEHANRVVEHCSRCMSPANKFASAKTAGKLLRKSADAEAAKLLKQGLKFKPIKPGVKPTGPGSKRGSMDPRAWESRKGK